MAVVGSAVRGQAIAGRRSEAIARSGQRPATENVAYPCENDPRAEVGEKTIAVLQNQSNLNGFAESMAAQSPIRLAAIKRLTLLLRQ